MSSRGGPTHSIRAWGSLVGAPRDLAQRDGPPLAGDGYTGRKFEYGVMILNIFSSEQLGAYAPRLVCAGAGTV